MIDRDRLRARVVEAKRESKYIEFKRELDTASAAAWCELIKDIVAIANSSGGAILFGVENNGTVSAFDVGGVLSIDIADITNRVQRYTNYHFADLEVTEVMRPGGRRAAFLIGPADVPMVFTRPGTYDNGRWEAANGIRCRDGVLPPWRKERARQSRRPRRMA